MARVKFLKNDGKVPSDLITVRHFIWCYGRDELKIEGGIQLVYRDSIIELSVSDAVALSDALMQAASTYDGAVELEQKKYTEELKKLDAKRAKKEVVK